VKLAVAAALAITKDWYKSLSICLSFFALAMHMRRAGRYYVSQEYIPEMLPLHGINDPFANFSRIIL